MNVTNTASTNNTNNVVNSPGNDSASIKNEFMTLMIAQIKNQDPTNPIDGTEYVSQLA
ncbi:flagellar hook capping FlgD N-terminal domain-containing protein, partial [Shewanella sp. 0m-11]